jgi:hypothetical protein
MNTKNLFSNLIFVVNTLLTGRLQNGGNKRKTCVGRKKRRTNKNKHRTYKRKQSGGSQVSLLLFVLTLILTVSVQAFCAELTDDKRNITKIAHELQEARMKLPRFSRISPTNLTKELPFYQQDPAKLQKRVIESVYNLCLNQASKQKMNFTAIVNFLSTLPYQIDIANSVLYIGNVSTGDMVLTMTPNSLQVYTKSNLYPINMTLKEAFDTNRSTLLQYDKETPSQLTWNQERTLNFPSDALRVLDKLIELLEEAHDKVHEDFNKASSLFLAVSCFITAAFMAVIFTLQKSRTFIKELGESAFNKPGVLGNLLSESVISPRSYFRNIAASSQAAIAAPSEAIINDVSPEPVNNSVPSEPVNNSVPSEPVNNSVPSEPVNNAETGVRRSSRLKKN